MASDPYDPRQYAIYVTDTRGLPVGVTHALYNALKDWGLDDEGIENYVRAMWETPKLGRPAAHFSQFIKRPKGPA